MDEIRGWKSGGWWKLLIASANNKAPHGINYEFDNDYKIPFTKLYKCRTIAERGGFCGKWRGRLKIALSNRPWRVLYTIELPLWANDLGLAGWLVGWLGEWLCLELSNPKPINATPQVTIRKPNVIIQPSFHLLPLLPLFCPQQFTADYRSLIVPRWTWTCGNFPHFSEPFNEEANSRHRVRDFL